MTGLSADLPSRTVDAPRPVWLGEVVALGTCALCAGGVAFFAGSAVLLLGRDTVSHAASLQLAEMASLMLAVGGALRWLTGRAPAGARL